MSTVLALYRPDDLAEHREALCEWLTGNGLDPVTVAMRWVSVEDDAGQRLIRYLAFRMTPDGRGLADPDEPNRVWTEERTAPLLTGLPDVASRCVTVRPAGVGGDPL